MKNIVTKFTMLMFSAIALFGVMSCGKLDVVGSDSKKSFERLLEVNGGAISKDEMNGGWSLASPDGQARFVWSWDYSASPLHDVMLVFDAMPFIAAGLDPEQLPPDIAYYDDMIMVGAKLGDEQFSAETPLAAYEHIVDKHRSAIGYHASLDHYGVSVGGGNLFEWAKDMNTNEKDIVFVLNPDPFIAAGVQPDSIPGWAFAKVTIDDENGKPVEVDKILKPFNLK
ncbi:MAG: hypothetical protein LBT01_02140 [Spirochaetaceae bacterium]|jgi:hypothetical protein|nr:hypothetical protein [Spirochaetaceae bacterium]